MEKMKRVINKIYEESAWLHRSLTPLSRRRDGPLVSV